MKVQNFKCLHEIIAFKSWQEKQGEPCKIKKGYKEMLKSKILFNIIAYLQLRSISRKDIKVSALNWDMSMKRNWLIIIGRHIFY